MCSKLDDCSFIVGYNDSGEFTEDDNPYGFHECGSSSNPAKIITKEKTSQSPPKKPKGRSLPEHVILDRKCRNVRFKINPTRKDEEFLNVLKSMRTEFLESFDVDWDYEGESYKLLDLAIEESNLIREGIKENPRYKKPELFVRKLFSNSLFTPISLEKDKIITASNERELVVMEKEKAEVLSFMQADEEEVPASFLLPSANYRSFVSPRRRRFWTQLMVPFLVLERYGYFNCARSMTHESSPSRILLIPKVVGVLKLIRSIISFEIENDSQLNTPHVFTGERIAFWSSVSGEIDGLLDLYSSGVDFRFSSVDAEKAISFVFDFTTNDFLSFINRTASREVKTVLNNRVEFTFLSTFLCTLKHIPPNNHIRHSISLREYLTWEFVEAPIPGFYTKGGVERKLKHIQRASIIMTDILIIESLNLHRYYFLRKFKGLEESLFSPLRKFLAENYVGKLFGNLSESEIESIGQLIFWDEEEEDFRHNLIHRLSSEIYLEDFLRRNLGPNDLEYLVKTLTFDSEGDLLKQFPVELNYRADRYFKALRNKKEILNENIGEIIQLLLKLVNYCENSYYSEILL